MFIRPSMLRLIPGIIVGLGWLANVAAAYIRGGKILKKKEESNDKKDT